MHKRLFIALPIPEATQHVLVARRSQLPLQEVKWVKEQNFHLTLRFLGHQEEVIIPTIHAALSTLQAKAFPLMPAGLGTFNEHHVLWVGVQKSEPLMQLKQSIDTALVPLGFMPEEKAFQPHITLARLKAQNRRKITHWLDAHSLAPFPAFEVKEFILYESCSTETGVEYIPLQRYKIF